MNDDSVGIILAAGLSTRMGRPKLALEIAGIPIVVRVTQAAVASTLKRIVIVCGHHPNNIGETLGDLRFHPKLELAANPHPELGMSESLRIGISTLGCEASGAMILLGDQPLITPEAIDQILNVWRKDPTRIVVPTIKGRKTTPAIFPQALFDELRQVTGDMGGRNIISRNREQVVLVELAHVYDDSDVDSAADYERLANPLRSDKQLASHGALDPQATDPRSDQEQPQQ